MPNSPSAEELAAQARAPATVRGYARDMAHFEAWCADQGEAALPATPATVGAYLAAHCDSLAPATLKRRLAAILVAHRQAGHPLDRRDPRIADVMAGIRRRRGVAPRRKEALPVDSFASLVAAQPTTLIGVRDRAVLLLGFAGALRRSEIVGLSVADLCFTSEGLALRLRRSKEDQEGAGMLKAIPFGSHEGTCPVRAVRRWLVAARLPTDGPLFRAVDRYGNVGEGPLSGRAIGRLMERAVRRWGKAEEWPRAEIERRLATLSAHSLRISSITACAAAGVPEWAIQQHSGHRQTSTLRTYIRDGDLFERSPIKKVGL